MANKKASKKKKIGVYRCTETGANHAGAVRITANTPKLVKKFSSILKKHTEHKLSEKTK